MTAQEEQMLQGLIDRVNKTQLAEKDPDAEATLRQGLGQNADALYILAQTTLVQEYALNQAQRQLADARAQVEQLRQQAQQPAKHTSFLGSLLGRNDDEPARQAPPPPPPPAQSGYQQVPQYPAPPAAAPAYGGGFAPAPAQGGFLRSAMQTATGVAAGALAFEGIESLMHGFGHPGYGYGGGGFGDVAMVGRPEEVINNYYGDAAPGQEHGEHTDFVSPGMGGSSDLHDASYVSGGDNFGSGTYTDTDTMDPNSAADVSDDSGYDNSSDTGGDTGGDFDSGGDFSSGDDSSGNF